MSYGKLLGEHFHMISRIGNVTADLDEAEFGVNTGYQWLLEERDHLKARLDEVSAANAASGIKRTLDEVFGNS